MLDQIEEGFLRESKACAARLVGAYAEKVDAEIVSDRFAQRETGHRVERRGDERRIQTMLGEVSYCRTYFQKVSGGYEYLADNSEMDRHILVSDRKNVVPIFAIDNGI